MTLLEAARWAPSAFNEQPWRFIYAHKNSATFEKLLDSMVSVNQNWAKNAAVLVVVVSNTLSQRTGEPSPYHTFDAGSAWMSIALQGSISGLVIDAIGGFDREETRKNLAIPAEFKIEIIIAIGKPGNKESLSPELQAREVPNNRKPLNEIVFEDTFSTNK